MLRYLSLDMIVTLKLTIFFEFGPQKTVSFLKQVISADKYLSVYHASKQGLWLANGMAVLTQKMVKNF